MKGIEGRVWCECCVSVFICVCVFCLISCLPMQGPLMNWLKVNFSQVFSAWVHLKALRVFTESVLRYVKYSFGHDLRNDRYNVYS